MDEVSKHQNNDLQEIGCSISIKSLFDSTKIVPKGVVRSMDPNTEVEGQALGPNWCEIQVLVVLQREESLIRPYDLLQRFGDALGGMIAWPCLLHDAACRVIARLKKEMDEARPLLAHAER